MKKLIDLAPIFEHSKELDLLEDEQIASLNFIKCKYQSIDYNINILSNNIDQLIKQGNGGNGHACPPPLPNTSWHVFPSMDTGNVNKVWWILDSPQTQKQINELRTIFRRRLGLLRLREKWHMRATYAKDGAAPYFWRQNEETEKST